MGGENGNNYSSSFLCSCLTDLELPMYLLLNCGQSIKRSFISWITIFIFGLIRLCIKIKTFDAVNPSF